MMLRRFVHTHVHVNYTGAKGNFVTAERDLNILQFENRLKLLRVFFVKPRDTETNPGHPVVDPSKTIIVHCIAKVSRSLFGHNAGRQCVTTCL